MSGDPRCHEELIKALQINVKICIDTQQILNITHTGSTPFAIKQTVAKTAELMADSYQSPWAKASHPPQRFWTHPVVQTPHLSWPKFH